MGSDGGRDNDDDAIPMEGCLPHAPPHPQVTGDKSAPCGLTWAPWRWAGMGPGGDAGRQLEGLLSFCQSPMLLCPPQTWDVGQGCWTPPLEVSYPTDRGILHVTEVRGTSHIS